ncbi:MAG TPA: DinB family protein [Bacteroidia bacterium]|jgi:uncharacterized damage-inducible protein DinB|nr:DinB family protein [Bacteroidia bacterium]
MNLTTQIAKQFRAVYTGSNWTGVNLKDTLEGITWQQATTKVHDFNTIALLVFHMNYYVGLALKVLQGEPLDGHDKYSFDMPPVESQEDWEKLLNKLRADAETFAGLVERLPDTKLEEIFWAEKYGTYYRNITGIVEHNHYHLGQIVLIKKMILQKDKDVNR